MGEESILARRLNRRRFLAGAAAATLGGAAIATLGAQCDPAIVRRVVQAKNSGPPQHRVWVWQFSTDGEPAQIAANLAANHLGVMVKTHDGTDWMSTYDPHPMAVSGPAQVQTLANFFESRGVPFHAWCVVSGANPTNEALMAVAVLRAGARSLTLDVEGGSGFWYGSAADAVAYGNVLRAGSAYGRVEISIDPRPWRVYLVPMDQFVTFTDAIAPQIYWDTFNSQPNIDRYAAAGYVAGPGGITPEFLLDATRQVLSRYDRQIIPVGQGGCVDPATFPRFVRRAWDDGMGTISVWRYGVTRYETLFYLGQNPAGLAPQPPPLPTATARPTGTATATGTATSTPANTQTSTPTPTAAPTQTPTPSQTPSPTPRPATATPPPAATGTGTP